MVFIWIDLTLFLVYSAIMLFLLTGVKRAYHHARKKSNRLTSVSVIVVARNEEKNIAACLEALQRQQYRGPMEVLIVDDRSIDATRRLIVAFTSKNRRWKALDNRLISKWRNRKKGSIATAYEQARGDILLFTDADCRPPDTWVESMVEYFEPDTLLVVGFSPLQLEHKSFWHDMLTIVGIADAYIAAGTIGWGMGTTCAGRNLSYRRPLITQLGGYDVLPDSSAGDDDAILQAAVRSKQGKIKYSFSPNSQVPAVGPTNWKDFINQKKRHISAGKYYPLKQKIGYILLHGGNLGVWLFTFFILKTHVSVLWILLIKVLIDWLCISRLAKLLHRNIKWSAFLVWQLFYPFYHGISLPAALGEKFSWKDNN